MGRHYQPDNRVTKATWSKLNEEQVKEIKQAKGGKKGTGTALARKFGVSKSAVYRIWEGKNWQI
jgi:DNA-binding Xre family transcriptional regulator